jgi:hypothetical protein
MGAVAALAALVVLGTTVAVVQNMPDSRQEKAPEGLTSAPSPAAVLIEYAAADPAPVFEAVNVDGFTGRQRLARELDAFMAANSCGYFLVEADAGMGKTAFAAWLVRTRGYLFHFSRLTGGGSTRAALQNLSAQVIKRCQLADGGFAPEWTLTPPHGGRGERGGFHRPSGGTERGRLDLPAPRPSRAPRRHAIPQHHHRPPGGPGRVLCRATRPMAARPGLGRRAAPAACHARRGWRAARGGYSRAAGWRSGSGSRATLVRYDTSPASHPDYVR